MGCCFVLDLGGGGETRTRGSMFDQKVAKRQRKPEGNRKVGLQTLTGAEAPPTCDEGETTTEPVSQNTEQ